MVVVNGPTCLAQEIPWIDRENPPHIIQSPHGGQWVKRYEVDKRNEVVPLSGSWVSWQKGVGYFGQPLYYLRGYFTASYKQLANRTANWQDEQDRDPHVLGAFLVDASRYMPHQENHYSYPNSFPPTYGSVITVKCYETWWVTLRAMLPTFDWNYERGRYEFNNHRYDSDLGVTTKTHVKNIIYDYVP